jgi:(R,R)-butanediol dehydrogenase/meso-butanediol dehydrogenase/diacetyl reductase
VSGRPNVCSRLGYVGEVCDGGFAEMVSLPAQRLLRVPKEVPASIAALAEPLGVALRVIRRLDAPRGAPILIAGAGPIGGLAAILLSHLDHAPLGIIERNAARANLIVSLTGATVIGAHTSEIAAFAGPSGLAHAIEATGSEAMLTLLVESLSGGGRLAMVGLFGGRPALSANAVVEREIEIRGCSVFCDEQGEIVPMLPALVNKLRPILSPPVSLDQLPGEYLRLIRGESAFIKTIVQP